MIFIYELGKINIIQRMGSVITKRVELNCSKSDE